MKKPIQFAGALFITSLAIVTLAEQPRTNFPLRLALDLVDGSHIIGIRLQQDGLGTSVIPRLAFDSVPFPVDRT